MMADMNLAEFLEARYAEREAAAKAAAVDPVGAMEAHFEAEALHHEQDWRLYPERETDYDHGQADALHWASTRIRERLLPLSLHDPASVLADIAAKRAILAEHAPEKAPVHGATPGRPPFKCLRCHGDDDPWASGYCRTILLLAVPFATHPDYQEGWKP